MAFDYVFESNFETGSNSQWDSEVDGATPKQLDFPSYRELARTPWRSYTPYSGAYCMRAILAGQTGDAYVKEGDIDIAANTTNYFRFNLWFSPDFTATSTDTFNLFEAQETGNAAMATFGAKCTVTTNAITLGIGKAAPTTFGSEAIEKGVWYTIELTVDIDNAGSNDGTIDIYVTKQGEPSATGVFAAQVGSLDQTAVTHGVLGVQDHLATTTGTILFDNFVQDDGRIYPMKYRWPATKLMTQSGHAFVGPGKINNVTLKAGNGTDCTLTVYDTDEADTNDAYNVGVLLQNTAAFETVDPAGMPLEVTRGAYVVLGGTTPRAIVQIGRAVGYSSEGAVRAYGLRRGR